MINVRLTRSTPHRDHIQSLISTVCKVVAGFFNDVDDHGRQVPARKFAVQLLVRSFGVCDADCACHHGFEDDAHGYVHVFGGSGIVVFAFLVGPAWIATDTDKVRRKPWFAVL